MRYLGGMFCSRFGVPLKTAVRSNVALIGDAAGYHGIIPACISGHYLSEFPNKAIQTEDFALLTQYDKVRRKSTLKYAQMSMDITSISEDRLEEFLLANGKEATNLMLEYIAKLKV